jgi:hypothetical protein
MLPFTPRAIEKWKAKMRFPRDSQLASGMATIMTRPMLSISVLYLHLLLGAGDSECGINVSQSEFLSNSHQPQT